MSIKNNIHFLTFNNFSLLLNVIFILFIKKQKMAKLVEQTGTQTQDDGMFFGIISPDEVGRFLIKLFFAIIIVAILIFLSKLLATFIKKKIIKNATINEDDYKDKIANLIGDVIFYTLLIFNIFIGFEILGFDLGLLIGGLSFGLGFAFKEVLGNMIAGILILTTKDYTLGDLIKIEGTPGYFGYIEEITIRYTVLREFNNQKVIVPNLLLITSPIKTYTAEEYIRMETLVSVHYNSDLEKVKRVIVDAINQEKIVINKKNTDVIVSKFADSGIDLKIWFHIDPNGDISPLAAVSHINHIINKSFKENDITIPYPHTILTVDKNDKNLLKTILFTKK